MIPPGRKPKKYYVYIVKCADGTYYTGRATDISKRLRQHNGSLKQGAKYTRTRRPVELIFYEKFLTKSSAGKREAEIKKLTRREKEILIKKTCLLT